MKKLKNKKALLIIIPILVLLIGLVIGGIVVLNNNDKSKYQNEPKQEEVKELTEEVINATELKLKENYEVEIGANIEEINWLEFVENKDELTEDDKLKFNGISVETVDASKAGEYEYVLKYDNKTYTGKITIKEKEEEEKEETKEDKKEGTTASNSSTSTNKNTSSNNSSSSNNSNNSNSSSNNSSSNNSSGNSNSAPAPTPEPTPAVTCPPAKNVSNGGFTLTSDGNCGGAISYAGHSANVKWTCDSHGCDANVTSAATPNSNVLFVGGGGMDSTVGSYVNSQYVGEKMEIICWKDATTPTLQSIGDYYNITISRLSYQNTFTKGTYELENVKANLISTKVPQGEQYTKMTYTTYGYDFRPNGFIVVVGTALNNNVPNQHAYSWEQYFVN